MKINADDKLLLVKYSDMYGKDCRTIHKEYLKNNGYCWFGKYGTTISKKSIDLVLQSENPMIILTHKSKYYLCSIDKITYDAPTEGYPDYYNDELIKENMSVFFRITNIIDLDKKYLNYFIVNSSANPVSSAVTQSMASQFLIRSEKNIELEEEQWKN